MMNGLVPATLEAFCSKIARLPIAVCHIADRYAVRTGMNELIVSDVNPHMRRSRLICREEYEIAYCRT